MGGAHAAGPKRLGLRRDNAPRWPKASDSTILLKMDASGISSDVDGDGGSEEPLRARLTELIAALETGLVERGTEVRLVLLAALAGEHSLLIGPPGTAKSELARRLRYVFTGGGYFERLLTRFSVPEELFGPLSIKRLEQDEYHRLTEGYLPTASVAFLDEVFKANSAILNALLTILNERAFDNGVERVSTPLVSVVAASNEIPTEQELEALFDRFLVRTVVHPVGDDAFDALLLAADDWQPPVESARLAPSDLEQIREQSGQVRVPAGVRALLGVLRRRLADRPNPPSDRRWRKLVQLLQVAAHTDGRDEVSLIDCGLARWCLWSDPERVEDFDELFTESLRVLGGDEVERIGEVVAALDERIQEEHEATEQATTDDGSLLWRDRDGKAVTGAVEPSPLASPGGDPYYIPPPEMRHTKARLAFTFQELWDRHYSMEPNGFEQLERWTADPAHEARGETKRQPVMRKRRFSIEHIEGRRSQLETLRSDLSAMVRAFSSVTSGESRGLWQLRPPEVPADVDYATAATKAEAIRETVTTLLEKVGELEVAPS